MKKKEQKQGASKKEKEKEKDISTLIRENLEMNQEMYRMLKSVKLYILLQRIWFGLKVVLILIPIVLGLIYLPPIFQDWSEQYRGLLQSGSEQALEQVFPEEEGEEEKLDQEELKAIKEKLTPEQKRQLLQELQEE